MSPNRALIVSNGKGSMSLPILFAESCKEKISVLLQPLPTFEIVGTDAKDFRVKAAGMIHVFPVTELVHHDAVEDLGRGEHKKTIKIQVAFRTATAPARLLRANGDIAVTNAHDGRKVSDTLRDHVLRRRREGAQFFGRELRAMRRDALFLPRLGQMFLDPASMLEQKPLDLLFRHP